MNVLTVIKDIKTVVAGETGFVEHQPRSSDYDNPVENAPNTGVFRVVVIGTGQIKLTGVNRYVDLAIVVAEPLSGGNANQTNETAAIKAENLISALAEYAGSEAYADESIDVQISRNEGRSVTTVGVQINYKFTQE